MDTPEEDLAARGRSIFRQLRADEDYSDGAPAEPSAPPAGEVRAAPPALAAVTSDAAEDPA
ncbi:MAG: hypothetical protein M3010_12005, partial [Candidatus Dormibacteraeota bacterium]|nr:hypothetical protein [Candidatus Dormibacteraeota bacterium]